MDYQITIAINIKYIDTLSSRAKIKALVFNKK